MKDLVVIGGGAAGMAAAIAAARWNPRCSVTLLEALDRVGKKILATGNGRCNLTNSQLTPSHYHSSDPEALNTLLSKMPLDTTLNFFSELGLLYAEEDMGRIYPYSRQASTVLDVLIQGLEQFHVNVQCGCKVTELRPGKGGFTVRCENGRHFQAQQVILTGGGKAAPKHGSDGSCLALTKQLSLPCQPVYPCLTAFRCENPQQKGLKGIRAQGKLTLLQRDIVLAEETGEIQFTDYGLSGIPAFQLSCHWKPNMKDAVLSVDLLPQFSYEAVLELIAAGIRRGEHQSLEYFLPGLIHKKLLYTLTKQVGLSPLSRPISSVSGKEQKKLAHLLKDWRFPVSGPLDWAQAQVTGGGVSLSCVDEHLQVQTVPGLYLAGELLDVVGDCGGYNLHWAWCSGILAGQHAAQIK